MRYPPPIVPADFTDTNDAAFIAGNQAAPVERTAPGTAQGNRLRPPPDYGVTALRLQAGRASSRSYLLGQRGGSRTGADDFHFAPELETIQIVYTLNDQQRRIARAKLELFRRHDPTAIWTEQVQANNLTHGDHLRDWTGSIAQSDRFPDGFVTAWHSPYKLKLTIAGDVPARRQTAWTYFHVLVADLILEMGNREVLASQKDRDVCDDADTEALHGALPAPNEKRKVFLLSNIFKTDQDQMAAEVAFSAYEAAWDGGPKIPVFAQVKVKHSDNRSVDAPKALGHVKFLWDWEDVREEARGAPMPYPASVRSFLTEALDFDRLITQPPGDNCHTDRGGKRGRSGPPLFPPQAGYDPADALRPGEFPFTVEACTRRTWAALSTAWTRGALAGKTGVLFQPSRLAGDAYKLSVYYVYDPTPDDAAVPLDVMTPPPLDSPIHKSTGTFEIWRKVYLARYVRKSGGIDPFDVPTVQRYFEPAFVRLADRSGGVTNMDPVLYNQRLRDRINRLPIITRRAFGAEVDHYAKGSYAFWNRSFSEYVEAIRVEENLADRAAALNWLPANLRTTAAYEQMVTSHIHGLVEGSFSGFVSRDEGITIIQFEWACPLAMLAVFGNISALDGLAADLGLSASAGGDHVTDRCGIFLFVPRALHGGYRRGGSDHSTLEQTVAHEIGHQMLLAHAPFAAEGRPPPDGAVVAMHDIAWRFCMMGYAHEQVQHFCGLCLLRLRGWKTSQMSNRAAQNRRRPRR